MKTLSILLLLFLVGCASPAQKEKAVAAAPSSPAPTMPTAPDGFYYIQPGDTGAKIARAHDLSLADLSAMNPDVNWARLRVGQMIRLKAKE